MNAYTCSALALRPQVRKVGDYTSKLVAGMKEDLDALSERVKNRNGDGDTEALLAVSSDPMGRLTSLKLCAFGRMR